MKRLTISNLARNSRTKNAPNGAKLRLKSHYLEMRYRSYLYKPTLFGVGFLLGLSIFVNQYPTLKSPK